MKTRLLLFVALSISGLAAFAQETDDMYFSSKDRAKLNALKSTPAPVYASVKKAEKISTEESDVQPLNPTDSYSARNVNPEFAARENAEVARTDDENYFSPDYHYNNTSDLNSWNNNFSSQYNNSWYQNGYWTPGMYAWNSPYYGNNYGGYDPWANLWYSPYSRPGWNSSISFTCGNAWNYGYGSSWSMSYGYGYGNGYGYGYRNPYNSYWYNPYSYWGGGYPQVVVVERGSNHAYGKRNSRSTSTHGVAANTGNGRPAISSGSFSGRSSTGGRLSSSTSRESASTSREAGRNSRQQTEYYDRSWRANDQPTLDNSGDSRGNNTQSDSRQQSSPSRNSSRSSDSGSSDNSSSYTPSRSSGSSSGSSSSYSPSRSSGNSGNSGNSGSSYSPSRSSGSSGSSSSGSGSRSGSSGSSGGGGRSRGR